MSSDSTMVLSMHDAAVISALFDPEASLRLPVGDAQSTHKTSVTEPQQELKSLEREALLLINEAEPSIRNIEECIRQLTLITTTFPTYASAWNNRAQARRMLLDMRESASHPDDIKSVYTDLSRAIDLSTARTPTSLMPWAAATVLASAHTHRGYILWHASFVGADENMLSAIPELRGLSKGRLEELASEEFAIGGSHGYEVARQLAIKTNPYAKLCGSIVKDALRKEVAQYQLSGTNYVRSEK